MTAVRCVKRLVAALASAVFVLTGFSASAQRIHVRGAVSDSATAAPLPHARAEWRNRATLRAVAAYTDAAGRFTIELESGRYDVLVSRLGYSPRRLDDSEVIRGGSTFHVSLSARGVPVDPIVVSVSRSEQARLDAPASVSVIGREAIEANLGLDALDQIRTLPGVDFVSKGLVQNTLTTRGPRTPTPRGLLMLTDNRYGEVPSILGVSFLRPATREDIERIEVVRGPGAALYGPGAPQGIVHMITRSPFESQGGVVSITGGGRSVRQGTARYAGMLHRQFAVSASADYLEGDDWESIDSVEIDNRNAAVSRGADPDTLRIARRNYFFRRAGGEARLDWRPGAQTEVLAKAGIAVAANAVDLSGLGAVQLRDWTSWYVQSRLQHAGLMINAMLGVNNSGDTYYLRTGAPLVEKSQLLAVHLQHAKRHRGVELIYGTDMRATVPRTGGTVHGSYEDDDLIRETGSYIQATTSVGPALQFVSALRVDHHSRMEDLVFSPRAALVYKPGRMHSLRLTYNRAFSSPAPNELFLDVRVNSLPGFPYEIRQHRVPRNGFTFPRGCNGLCMRSPFTAGGSDLQLPADATRLWDEMVALLALRGISMGDIPAPSATAVNTVLAIRNQGARVFETVLASDVRDLPPLRRQITNVLELGYRGAFRGGATFSADLHATRVRDRLLGTAIAATPNVFFDRETLEKYLTGYRDSQAAAQLAKVLAEVPVGIVTPVESPYPTDILLVGRQGQAYTLWGLDLTAEVRLGSRLSVFGTYSLVSYDTVSAELPDIPVSLAIPKQKAALEATHRNGAATLVSSVRVRGVGAFTTRGRLFREPGAPGYGVMDVSTTYRVPPARRLSIGAEVRNVFDHVHRETPGGAAIGRLGVIRTRLEF